MPGIRPKEFDVEEAVDAAMRVFWQRGYEGAKLPDLLTGLGIARQSLYNAFGDKRQLFLRALEHYSAGRGARQREVLLNEGSPLSNLRSFVSGWTQHAHSAEGCLMANTAAEVGCADGEIAQAVARHVGSYVGVLEETLRAAQDQGELRQDADVSALAQSLVTTSFGLALMARVPGTEVQIQRTVAQALAQLNACCPASNDLGEGAFLSHRQQGLPSQNAEALT